MSITTLVFQDELLGYILSYFYKLLRALFLSRFFVEFFLKAVYLISMVEKIPSNLWSSDSQKMHLWVKNWMYTLFFETPQSKHSLKFFASPPRVRGITNFPWLHFIKSLFPRLAEKGRGEKTINQLNNMTMIWNNRLFMLYMIHNFFRFDYFTVLLIKYLSCIVVVILLSILCKHDNLILKLYQIEMATVAKNGFLLADSKFEVYQEWEIKKLW